MSDPVPKNSAVEDWFERCIEQPPEDADEETRRLIQQAAKLMAGVVRELRPCPPVPKAHRARKRIRIR